MLPLMTKSLAPYFVAKDGDWSVGVFGHFELKGVNLAAEKAGTIAALIQVLDCRLVLNRNPAWS